MYRWILLGTMLAGGLSGYTQSPCHMTLSGVVTDALTGEALAFAQVFLHERSQGYVTDSAGRYRISGICPGHITLTCHHLGGAEQVVELDLYRDTALAIMLAHRESQLADVTIRQVRGPSFTQAAARLEGHELTRHQGESLGNMLEAVPGVTALRTGSSIVKPVIHGLHSNRLVILNNGIRQEGQQWGSEHAPEIDPFIATRLTVLKGASAVRYGAGAMAGVILVEPAPLPDSTGLGGEWTVAGASNGRMGISSGRLEGRLAALPLAWRVQGTFKQGGNLQAPGYYLENTGIRENNYSLTLGYHTARRGMEVYYSQFRTRLGILSPAHTGSIRDLEAAIARTIPLGADTVDFTYALRRPYQEVSHHLLKWSGYLRSDRLGSLRTTYAFQQNLRLEYDKHRPRGTDATGADLPELNFLLFTHTLETTWDKTYRGWSLTAGAAGLYQNNQLDGRPFIPNFVVIGGESFVIAYGVREKWSWEAGIRYDYRWLNSAREERGVDIYQVRTYQSLSGTLGLHRHLSRDLRITLNAGTAWRPPHVNELFSDGVHHGAAAYERGDSTLLPEQALMIQAALLWQRPRFSAELTPYLNVFSNFIYLQPDGLEVTIRGTFPAFQYSQTPALLTGADLSLGWQILPSLRYKTKASWLYAQNLGTQTPLALMPANRMSHNLTWTWPGVGSMTDTYLGLGMTAVAAQRRFPADQDLLNPPDGYTLLDAEAGTSLHWRAYCLRIALTGQNLLNTTYRDYLNRFRYFADEPGRNLSLRLTLML